MQSENVINSLNKSLTSESNDDVIKEFMERIQTYINGQIWVKKPMALSPPVCSQYGWKCIKSDLLECVTCSSKLSVHEPKLENFEAYKACIKKMINDLKDSHGKHCPWPLTPSPENFVRMVLMPKEEALSQFLKRLKSCMSYKSSIPKIKESVFVDLGFIEQQITALCKMAKTDAEDAKQFGKSVVSLAATGWIITKESEIQRPVFKCSSCQRSVWCGSFSLLNSCASDESISSEDKNAETVSANDVSKIDDNKENAEEPPCKKKRISFGIKNGEPFDPVHEHRPWCLWICSGVDDYTSQLFDAKATKVCTKSSDTPGWKIFMKSLLRNVSDIQTLEITSSPSREHIRNVRSLLEKWTDAV